MSRAVFTTVQGSPAVNRRQNVGMGPDTLRGPYMFANLKTVSGTPLSRRYSSPAIFEMAYDEIGGSAVLVRDSVEHVAVGDVLLVDVAEVLGPVRPSPGLQVVDADELVAGCVEAFGQVRGDEPRRACHEDFQAAAACQA
jgi:hypothetical protein